MHNTMQLKTSLCSILLHYSIEKVAYTLKSMPLGKHYYHATEKCS